jgi:nitrogen fixation NifU-like protein
MHTDYSDLFHDHLENARNVGKIDNPDGFGEARTTSCGDVVRITINVRDDVITEIKFKAYGCSAVIAGGSLATEMSKGWRISDVQKITAEVLAEKFGKIPENKLSCLDTVVKALHAAVNNAKEKE